MKRINNAIRDTGGTARIPGNDGPGFTASIQPLRQDDGRHTEIGNIDLLRYKIYAVCCDESNSLKAGDMLEAGGKTYVVDSIDTYHLQDKPVFRKGILTAVTEAE